MRWLTVSAKRAASALLLASFMLLLGGRAVYAVDSEIGAYVCGGGGATISIAQPQNDSVVSQPIVTLSGTVENATQIEVLVDDQYSATIPIGLAQITYSADITLSEGTHTIKLTANDVCQTNNASTSIVLTYQLETQSSDGNTTPTEVGNGGVTISGQELPKAEDGEVPSSIARLQNVPIIGAAVGLAINAFNASGLDMTAQDGVILATVRVVLTVIAVFLVAFAGGIAPIAVQLSPQLAQLYAGNTHRVLMYTRWFLRLGALPLLIIIYFL